MNYRHEIVDMTIHFVASNYDMPHNDSLLAKAVEEEIEYWFSGDFEFDCIVDARNLIDHSLAERVMDNYYQKEVFERYRRLEQEENRSMFHRRLI
jgi:hypothetical protein